MSHVCLLLWDAGAESGNGKTQEASTGQLLHVEKKTGGVLRGFLGGWWQSPIPLNDGDKKG